MPSIAIPVSLRGQLLYSTRIFDPLSLFALNEPGLWLDPSDVANLDWRRNLLTYTEQFDNAIWTKLNATVTANAGVDPLGTSLADAVVEDATASAVHRVNISNIDVTSGRTYVFSVYAKAQSVNFLFLNLGTALFGTNSAVFNLSTGAVVSASGVTASIQNAGNGWYRCIVVATATASGVSQFFVSPSDNSSAAAYTGVNGRTSALIWGAQLELGSVATDYQRISDVNTEVIERFPSATLYQDTAGTTPVTTPGQTVALALDKSKGLVLGTPFTASSWTNPVGGWDVFSSTGSSFTAEKTTGGGTDLAYSNTSSFTLGAWYQITVNVTATTLTSYTLALSSTTNGRSTTVTFNGAGVKTALIQANVASGSFSLSLSTSSLGSISVASMSIRELPGFHATQATTASRPTYGIVPLGGRRNLLLATDTMATQSLTVAAVAHTLAFTGTGTVTLTGASIAGPLVGTGASNRVSLSFTPTAASLTLTVVGSVTLAQLELGSTATAYQRVGTAFDVTEAGVQSLSYLSFDGVDDFLVTPTITPNIDKAQVFAGVRKIADTNSGVIVDNITGSTDGQFQLLSGFSVAGRYAFVSKGSVQIVVEGSGYTSPITNVLTGLGDISGDRTTLRVNGIQAAQSTSDQGAGNYLAYPLYIGRRGGTMFPLNGQIYSLIVRFGANLDAGTITSTETWVNGKTGAYA